MEHFNRNYLLLSTCTVAAYAYMTDWWATLGLIGTLAAFGLNAHWLTAAVSTTLKQYKNEETKGSENFIASVRFFAFLVAIIVILLAFGWVPVLVGNSLSVCTFLGTALLSNNYQTRDNSDGTKW